jgi:hypothetical protein
MGNPLVNKDAKWFSLGCGWIEPGGYYNEGGTVVYNLG